MHLYNAIVNLKREKIHRVDIIVVVVVVVKVWHVTTCLYSDCYHSHVKFYILSISWLDYSSFVTITACFSLPSRVYFSSSLSFFPSLLSPLSVSFSLHYGIRSFVLRCISAGIGKYKFMSLKHL